VSDDDYFFAPPPSQQPPSVPPPVMPPVMATARYATPRTRASFAATAAAIGGALMLLGAWAPWVTVSVFNRSEHVGGLRSGLDGKWILALGIAVILAAAVAAASQANPQARMICGGVLLALGLVVLGIVIHDWTTVSDRVREVNTFFHQFGDQLNSSALGSTLAGLGLDSFRVSKAWGLMLSGVAGVATAASGVYLLVSR
jgi:hypothetical protein